MASSHTRKILLSKKQVKLIQQSFSHVSQRNYHHSINNKSISNRLLITDSPKGIGCTKIPQFNHSSKRFLHVSSSRLATKKNYYEILGVAKNASSKDVKNAYYKMAKEFHPDTNKSPDGHKKFQEVSEAYEVLSDDTKRREYDSWGQTSEQMGRQGGAPPPGAGGFGGGAGNKNWDFHSQVDPEELFRRIFGDQSFRTSGNPFGDFQEFQEANYGYGSAQEIAMTLTFEEAARGVHKDVRVNVTETCPKCSGSRCAPGSSPVKCRACNGTGMETIATGPFVMRSACRRCRGSRQTIQDPCPECQGKGTTVNRKKVTVPVPAGVEDSQTVRMPVGRKEVFITFRVEKSDYFRRDGSDVHTDASVSISQSVLGGSTRIKGIYENVTIDIPETTSSHTRIRLRGKGIKKVNGFGYGDHYVHLKVQAPTTLSASQEALIRAYAELETNTPGTVKGVIQANSSGSNTTPGDETQPQDGKSGAGEILKKIKDAIFG